MHKIKFFSKHFLWLIWRFIELSLAFLIVAFALAFWYLSSKPADVKFLLPQLNKLVLSDSSNLKIQADSALLSAKISKNGFFHVEIKNLTVIQNNNNNIILELPELTASYGLWKVIRFNYFPDTLTLEKPFLQLMIDKTGSFYLENPSTHLSENTQQKTTESASTLIDTKALFHKLMGLKRVQLNEADILFNDERIQKNFSFSNLNFVCNRKKHTMPAEFSGVLFAQDSLTNISGKILFNAIKQNIEFDLSVNNLDIPSFASLYEPLKDIQLTVKGNIIGELNLKALNNIPNLFPMLSFSLQNQQKGNVSLPAPLTNIYHVKDLSLNARFTPALKKLIIDNSFVTLEELPPASLTGEITGIDAFLTSADKKEGLSKIKTVLSAQVKEVPMSLVPSVWPKALGTDAHEWTEKNITEGLISKSDWLLNLTGDNLDSVNGDMDFKGAKIRYLEEMPAVENVSGKVNLTLDTMKVIANSGNIGKISLKKGEIALTELQEPVSHANLRLSVQGPASDVVKLIDYKPLEFAKMFDIKPSDVSGNVSGTVDLKFPLIETLSTDQVNVLVNADIQKATFSIPFKNQKLSEGTLNLKVNNQMLNISGGAFWDKTPLYLMWDEYFTNRPDHIKSNYKVTFTTQENALKPFIPDIEQYITGTISGNILLKELIDGTMKFSLESDLTKAKIPLYPISYEKKENKPAHLKMESQFKKSQEMKQMKLSFKTSDVNFLSDINWNKGFGLKINTLTAPKTNITGTLTYEPEKKFALSLKGTKLDISDLFKMPYFKETKQPVETPVIKNTQRVPADLNISVQLDELVCQKDFPIKNISANIVRSGFYWKDFSVDLKAASPLKISFNPQKGLLNGSSNNTGDLANRLGITPRLVGGKLQIKAKQPPVGGLKGKIIITNMNLKEPGFLTQALSILGILDAITGKPLNFKEVKIPFEWTPQNSFYIEDGVAYGTTLGITFKGQISSQLQLSGSIIPAYAINSLPGKIPVIGTLFRDSKGGGLMGVKYTTQGSLFDPNINFNPLSSVAPGVLGRLLN